MTDIDAYRRDGYLFLGSVLDADEVAELKAEEGRLRLPVGFGAEHNQTLRVNIQLCDRSEPTRRFATAGRHLDAVEALLGPDLCLTHQQYIAKLPDGPDSSSDIPFHQDNGYGRIDPPTDVTVWVALDATTDDNGCLHILPGSHDLGLVDHGRGVTNPFLREAGVDASSAVALPMAAGEAVAFTGNTLHGSGPNRTPHERVGLFVRYCEPSARMASEGDRPVLEDPNSWMVRGQLS